MSTSHVLRSREAAFVIRRDGYQVARRHISCYDHHLAVGVVMERWVKWVGWQRKEWVGLNACWNDFVTSHNGALDHMETCRSCHGSSRLWSHCPRCLGKKQSMRILLRKVPVTQNK